MYYQDPPQIRTSFGVANFALGVPDRANARGSVASVSDAQRDQADVRDTRRTDRFTILFAELSVGYQYEGRDDVGNQGVGRETRGSLETFSSRTNTSELSTSSA